MRFLFALLTTFCLLFQQTVVVASACVMETMPANAAAMLDHCAGMDMATESPTLCKGHCAPDLVVLPDCKSPTVHFVAMSPPPLDLLLVSALPDPVVPAIRPVHGSDPPPRLRYCRLLI
ncbi:MAG TPA: hypothetical protein VFN25_15790 [Dokdonella sp.]|uniref:hypothetical protein n=1 Tax=Dokdonella sp. TaxID=2291710 RepID=UPI002D8092AB|nr:hypothetical protein [Dokdonella sp.]HET9034352.1 hypothetical protein [Dokdonella sp.]